MVRILQCVFWLSIVYAAILTHGTFRLSELQWDVGALARHAAAQARTAGPSAVDLSGTLAAGTTFCARHADECLADAKQLTALFAGVEPQTLRQATGDDEPTPARELQLKRKDAKPARTP